jgi:hypothetical protein
MKWITRERPKIDRYGVSGGLPSQTASPIAPSVTERIRPPDNTENP